MLVPKPQLWNGFTNISEIIYRSIEKLCYQAPTNRDLRLGFGNKLVYYKLLIKPRRDGIFIEFYFMSFKKAQYERYM